MGRPKGWSELTSSERVRVFLKLCSRNAVSCFEIDAHVAHEASLDRHRRNVGIFFTKNPADLYIVGPRLRIDRHLHVIAMLRDPRDVIVSKHSQDPDRYWARSSSGSAMSKVISSLDALRALHCGLL